MTRQEVRQRKYDECDILDFLSDIQAENPKSDLWEVCSTKLEWHVGVKKPYLTRGVKICQIPDIRLYQGIGFDNDLWLVMEQKWRGGPNALSFVIVGGECLSTKPPSEISEVNLSDALARGATQGDFRSAIKHWAKSKKGGFNAKADACQSLIVLADRADRNA